MESKQKGGSFYFKLSSSKDFSSTIISSVVDSTSLDVQGLPLGSKLYWKVRPVVVGSKTEWSDVWSFKTVKQSGEQKDRTVLMDLYRATEGDNWIKNSGWGSDAPMGTWYGIDTNAAGRVTRIDLWHNNLTGKIENIPWGVLNKVKYLNLKYNHLTGKIPASIGQMTSLRALILQGRSGKYNPYRPYKVGGTLKQPHAVKDGDWTIAYHQGKYYSNTNDFHGHIPATIGNLSNLVVLELSNAPHIVGPIPASFRNLTNLKGLYLSGDNFQGTTIGKWICNLTNLKQLYIEGAGLVGELPRCFENLTELIYINLGPFDDTKDIPENALTGNLPSFRGFTDLQELALTSNNFTGPFPKYFNNGNFTKLTLIYLAWNELEGTLPDNFYNLPDLYALAISGNNLTGSIKPLQTLPAQIKIIGIGWNNFSGEFPQSGWQDFYQLKTIIIGANPISGDIPCSFWEKIDNPKLGHVLFGEMPNIDNACKAGAKAMEGTGSMRLTLPKG